MFKNLKNFLNSRARRKAAEKMPRDEKGRFLDTTPTPTPVVAPSATKAPAKKAPAKKAPTKKTATPAPKKK
jgi:hypothetical protein